MSEAKAVTVTAAALESIGLQNIVSETTTAANRIGEVNAIIARRILTQFIHNLTHNRPRYLHLAKTERPEEAYDPLRHATHCGLMAGVAEVINWDVELAIQLAANLLSECNLHPEAAAVMKLMDGFPNDSD